MRGVDQEGIAEEIQAGPPLAMYSSDRQYLRSYYAAMLLRKKVKLKRGII